MIEPKERKVKDFSRFEVLSIDQDDLTKPIYIRMREIPIPRGLDLVIFVDDKTANNYNIAQPLELKGSSVVICTSTVDAIRVIEAFKWMTTLKNCRVRLM